MEEIIKEQIKGIKLSKREQRLVALIYNFFKKRKLDKPSMLYGNNHARISSYDVNKAIGTRSQFERVNILWSLQNKLRFTREKPLFGCNAIASIEDDNQITEIEVTRAFYLIMNKYITEIVGKEYLIEVQSIN